MRIFLLIILAFDLMLFLPGCSMLSMKGTSSGAQVKVGEQGKQEFNKAVSQKKVPATVSIKTKDGTEITMDVPEKTEISSTIGNITKKEDKFRNLTVMEKIGRFIGRLSFFAIIFFLVFGSSGLVIVRYVFNYVINMRRALHETVSAIQESGTVKEGNGLYHSLKAKQSKRTKNMIDKIKNKI